MLPETNSGPVDSAAYARLGLLGTLFSRLRLVCPTDKYLWPGAQMLARVTGLRAGRTKRQTADGFMMELDPLHYPDGAMLYGTFEVSSIRLVERIVRPGDVVCDIGGNIGYYAIRFSRLVGPTGQVFAFEPVPTTLLRLRANLRQNACTNVTVCPVALTNEAAPVTIYETASHGVAGLRPLSEDTISHAVDGVLLDDFLQTDRPVRLMKIDVEGAERLVLQGAQQRIARDRPYILLEKFSSALLSFGYDFADVAEQITRHGNYRVTAADRGTDLTQADAATLNAAPDGNYLFSPV